MNGKTLISRLEEHLCRIRLFTEKTVSLVMPGIDGMEKNGAALSSLRMDPPTEIGGKKVLALEIIFPARPFLQALRRKACRSRARTFGTLMLWAQAG